MDLDICIYIAIFELYKNDTNQHKSEINITCITI